MAINTYTPSQTTGTATYAAPTTSELIDVGDFTVLHVKVGATATTITVVLPGNDAYGRAVADLVYGPLTSTELQVRIPKAAIDPATGKATVTFSQVASVTAALLQG